MSCQKTPHSKMSSGLKDRLKRCGRYHASPLGTPAAKKVCYITNQTVNTADTIQPKPVGETDDIKTVLGTDICDNFSTPKLTRCYRQAVNTTPIAASSQSDKECQPNRLNFSPCAEPTVENVQIELTESNGNIPVRRLNQRVSNQRRLISLQDESESKLTLGSSTDNLAEVTQERDMLKKVVLQKQEELRKLKLVKMYRKKNDLDTLTSLINKWRGVSQQALIDLLEKMPEPKPSLTQLLDHLQIDHSLVQFCKEEETFT